MHKILFISRAYGEHAGGMERLSFELITEFGKADKFSVKKLVNEIKPNQSLFISRVQSALFVITILPKALLASRHADIVHIGDPVLSFVGWLIMRVRNIPVAVTVHGLDIAYQNVCYQLYLKLFFGSFSAYIPISDYAKKLLEKHSVRGVVSVIPPGIRDALYESTMIKKDLSQTLHRDISANIVLITIGRLVTRKGHEWFISHVIPSLPQNFLYVIAGSGPEQANIARTITSHGLEHRVLMLGRISHEDKKTLINTCDAFIQPNILIKGDAEGFGIAPLEAAVCNKPVFVSNIDGISSAIHDGKNGTLLESGNAEAWIHALTAFTPKETHAREYTLREFSWNAVTTKYKAVFNGL